MGTDAFICEIMMSGFNFAPRGWVGCKGQLEAISGQSAVYSLLGVNFGGDGRTNFAFPDFRGRVPVGSGEGLGLSNRNIGEKFGFEAISLNTEQLPKHSLPLNGNVTLGDTTITIPASSVDIPSQTVNVAAQNAETKCFTSDGNKDTPANGHWAQTTNGNKSYSDTASPGASMAADAIQMPAHNVVIPQQTVTIPDQTTTATLGTASMSGSTGTVGAGLPINISQPSLVVQFSINTDGLYPPRS
ncbi:MAG: tail fiber protein [Spirochaetota bacterium]